MHFRSGRLVTSASDLTTASHCEFAFLRALDARLHRVPAVDEPEDEMLERAARLGDRHESRLLERYRAEHPGGVVFIERPDPRDADAVARAVAETLDAFAAGAAVIAQATFADDDFIGYADFIVRRPDGRYLVQDAKLARRAKVTALLQLAAYADRLDRAGVPRTDEVQLLLGDGTVSTHLVDDIMPVYRLRRARLERQIAERLADTAPVAWGADDVVACGRCASCEQAVVEARDLFLVAALRRGQRDRLREAGIRTIDALAHSTGPVAGIGPATLDGLRVQASLQLRAELLAAGSPDPEHAPPPVELVDAAALASIPEPSPGDLFFDFEGDPLYTEDEHEWGLDYLFGMVDAEERYTPLWAHDLAGERRALEQFLELVELRRAQHPGLHIYHYAAYERTHLASIAARHGTGEAAVDRLLREGVLVDLYPIVKRALRVGSRSYSIKKLEPLYMGDEHREADVKAGGDSITAYVEARTLIAAGDGATDPVTGRPAVELGEAKLRDLADYNAYDCVSTLRLRDWLLTHARARGIAPLPPIVEDDMDIAPPSPLAATLLERAGGPAADRGGRERSPDETALALASAAIEYHRREAKAFWLDHFLRLAQPMEHWADDRDVFVVDSEASHAVQPWGREGAARLDRRRSRLVGTLAPGSSVKAGDRVFAAYRSPTPFPVGTAYPLGTQRSPITVIEVDPGGEWITIEEPASGAPPWSELPVALTPGPPPPAGSQATAIEGWANTVLDRQPDWPHDAAAELLRRRPPRSRAAGLAPVVDGDVIGAVVDSLLDLDDSYLAVQGPPGTGKTYVGSHVIARLVAQHGWRIGVVAQSHAVVENLLDRVVDAGLPAGLVGKAVKPGETPGQHTYTELTSTAQLAGFIAEHDGGYVVGGTAWVFSNGKQVQRRSLDLLVIDEAGQFALAPTIAAGIGARRLLLLGDPQQLPQVSQGIHPEPVDGSALGWIAAGHEVLPPEFGYFLAESRRMHPEVAAPVSRLSYEGALRSFSAASERRLDGVEPGLTVVPVTHRGHTTESPEEAAEVVRIVRSLLGRPWQEVTEAVDAATGEVRTIAVPARPLEQRDLIVVTPYNAQLQTVRSALDGAGFPTVPVGTVDKFQGQEAAVAIVSLAASDAADVPRGLEFLLLPNRLNVAISRAKWAAYLVYSPGLLAALPHTPVGVARLSRFARLVDQTPVAAPDPQGLRAG